MQHPKKTANSKITTNLTFAKVFSFVNPLSKVYSPPGHTKTLASHFVSPSLRLFPPIQSENANRTIVRIALIPSFQVIFFPSS
jgi:hypothetical protein